MPFLGFLAVLVLTVGIPKAEAVYWFYDYDPSKVYQLYGEADLIYQRIWNEGNKAENIFQDGITLGLKGFIVDRKLATFNVSGSFNQDIEQGNSTMNTYAFRSEVSLLNERVRRGILSFVPQPIRLKFEYEKVGDSKSLGYGVGLGYSRPGVLRFFQNGKIFSYDDTGWSLLQQAQVQNGTGINQNGGNGAAAGANPFYLTFPAVTLDYDRGTSSGQIEAFDSTSVDLRAESHSPHGDYFFDYLSTRNEYTDEPIFTYKHLEFDANLKFLGEKTSRFESWNSLVVDDMNSSNSFDARSSNTFTKSLGPNLRDNLALAAGGGYSSSNGLTDYSLTSSGTYSKLVSDRFRNSIIAQASYDQIGGHAENIGDSIEYRLSPGSTLSGTASIGDSTPGLTYTGGLSLAVFGKGIISTTGYFYTVSPDDFMEKTTQQTASQDFSGTLWRDMNFTSHNFYRITDIPGIDGYNEKELNLMGNVYWAIAAYRLSLGYGFDSDNRSDQPGTVNSTAISLTLSRYLERRKLLFTITGFYSHSNVGGNSYSIYPLVVWNYRLVTVTADYQLIRTEDSIQRVTEQRILVRVSRRIDYAIKPFLGSD
ncbi:MAG: hypothetical protein ABR903_01400 [Thermodesulfovibrionales bacterium]|jgi:hypothetical protein